MKRIIFFLVIISITFVLLPKNVSAEIYISPMSAFQEVGDTFTVRIKGIDKKVKWSVSNKNLKIIKKNKKSVKLKVVKTGTSVVKAKAKGKTYKCSVIIAEEITMN